MVCYCCRTGLCGGVWPLQLKFGSVNRERNASAVHAAQVGGFVRIDSFCGAHDASRKAFLSGSCSRRPYMLYLTATAASTPVWRHCQSARVTCVGRGKNQCADQYCNIQGYADQYSIEHHTHSTRHNFNHTRPSASCLPDYGTSSRDRFSGLSAPQHGTAPRPARSVWPPL